MISAGSLNGSLVPAWYVVNDIANPLVNPHLDDVEL